MRPGPSLLLVAALGAPGASLAAEPGGAEEPLPAIPVEASQAPGAAPPDEPTLLDDIVVTATKRPEPSREVPASITALSGRELEARGVHEMRDYLRQIPGVGLTELQPDLYRVSIRGIQADNSAVTPQTEGIFIDDIPLNDPFITQVRPDVAMFDLESVEILKGPQGTLFGGSGLAGAVRYRLADAAPGIWELRSFQQYQDVAKGSPNSSGGIAVNIPLGGYPAALRLAGVARLTGGTIDDLRNHETDTDETENYSGRALLRWNVSDDLSVGAKSLRQQTDAKDLPWAENAEGRLDHERVLRQSPSHTEFEVHGLDLGYEMSWAKLVSVTSWMRKEGILKNAYGERALGTEDSGDPVSLPTTADIEGLVQELRLQSPDDADGPWRWLIGAYGQDYSSYFTQRILQEQDGTETSLLDFVSDVDARELAVFGEVTRRFGARWRVTLGLRGYRVATSGTVVSSGPLILVSGASENRNDAEIEVSGVNPKLAVQLDLGESIGTYASVARGFRFGGIQIIGPSPASPNVPETYSPDRVWSYELGARTRWLDDSLQLDGAVFYIDWREPQVQSSSGGAVNFNVIDNADHARSYGAEALIRYLTPLEGLELNLSGGYTDAEITEPYTGPSGITVPAGSRLPGYARFQAAAGARYGWSWGGSALGASLDHVVLGDGVNDIRQSMKIYDYRTTDVRLSATNAALAGAPTLSLGVTNLTDERGIVSAFVFSQSSFETVYNRPRTVDLRLDLRF